MYQINASCVFHVSFFLQKPRYVAHSVAGSYFHILPKYRAAMECELVTMAGMRSGKSAGSRGYTTLHVRNYSAVNSLVAVICHSLSQAFTAMFAIKEQQSQCIERARISHAK